MHGLSVQDAHSSNMEPGETSHRRNRSNKSVKSEPWEGWGRPYRLARSEKKSSRQVLRLEIPQTGHFSFGLEVHKPYRAREAQRILHGPAENALKGYARLDGTFAPFLRASERPMAIACFLLVTRPPLPPFPECKVPRFFRRMALFTDFAAAFPYRAIASSLNSSHLCVQSHPDIYLLLWTRRLATTSSSVPKSSNNAFHIPFCVAHQTVFTTSKSPSRRRTSTATLLDDAGSTERQRSRT